VLASDLVRPSNCEPPSEGLLASFSPKVDPLIIELVDTLIRSQTLVLSMALFLLGR
jgi:hypothetical protein